MSLSEDGKAYQARWRAERNGQAAQDIPPVDDHPYEDVPPADEPDGSSRDVGRRIVVTRGCDVALRPLVWWEHGLILRAAVNLLGGREGRGKSTIAAHWAARETRDGGTVLWLGSEEPRAQAIAPRLAASGADMSRILFIDVEVDGGTGSLVLPFDLAALEATIRAEGVTMVVIDPAKGVTPSGFSGSDDIAVRQFLEPISALAERCDIVILGLVHFGKRDGDDSGKLILGSIAWSQVARSVLSVAEDPDTGHRIVTNTKANYTDTDRSVEFRFVSKTVHTEFGATEFGAAELIGDTDKDARTFLSGDSTEDHAAAECWLLDSLSDAADGRKAKELIDAAAKAGISRPTLYRAKKKLDIAERYEGFPRMSTWYLPSHLSPPACETTETTETTGLDLRKRDGLRETTGGADHQLSQLSHVTERETTGETTGLRVCRVCGQPMLCGQAETHLGCSQQTPNLFGGTAERPAS